MCVASWITFVHSAENVGFIAQPNLLAFAALVIRITKTHQVLAAMAAFDRQVFAAALILFVLTELGSCLQCFTCSSGPDDLCDDTFSYHAQVTVGVVSCEYSPHLSIPGAGPNTHCGKIKRNDHRAHQNDYVSRGCVPENYCRLVKSEVSECELCETDRCNSSSLIMPSCILGIITLLLVKLSM